MKSKASYFESRMKRNPCRQRVRENIAHIAARLMAEDGIEDYAQAKRKAARQLGAIDTRQLPDNDEIDAALKQYRALFKTDHVAELRQLRQLALAIMHEMAAFNPYLTGSLLSGTAGKYADIHLQLFTDNPKSVEHLLLEREVRYRSAEIRLYAGDMVVVAPGLIFDREGCEINLTLLTLRELRLSLKTSAAGKPLERANADAVTELLDLH